MRYVHIGTRIYLGEPDSSQRIFVVKDVELAPKKKADSAELAQKMQDMGIRENGHSGRVVFDVDWKTVVAITGDRVKSGEKSAGIGAKQVGHRESVAARCSVLSLTARCLPTSTSTPRIRPRPADIHSSGACQRRSNSSSRCSSCLSITRPCSHSSA